MILWLVLLGCGGPREGTSIGNPNKTLMRIAPPGAGIDLDLAELELQSLDVDGFAVDLPRTDDLLAGVSLDLPAGSIQSLRVEFAGPLRILGSEQGATLDLELDLIELELEFTRLPIELDQPHVFELGMPDWLDAEQVGWVRGEAHTVRPGAPEHDILVEVLRQGSALLLDADGDGQPDR